LDAETPLFITIHFFPDAKTPLFSTSFSSHSQNTTVHHFLTILHRRNNSVQQLFRLFPSVAETPLPATFLFFPLLKHRCQQPFIIFPDAETPLFSTFYSSTPKTLQSAISSPLSSTKQLRPAIVSPFPFCF
jgi:hypothetical protein